MNISKNGIDLIKAFEGLRTTAYKCAGGVLTIGYGHTGEDVKAGMSVNENYAIMLLQSDLQSAEKYVTENVNAVINQNQFDALVSFVFNVGVGNFKRSTLLKKINVEDYKGAAEEFTRWNKARQNGVLKPLVGLTRRRAAERQLFLNG